MKRLLNTLYIMTQGAYLSKDGETVQVQVEHIGAKPSYDPEGPLIL